MEPCEQKLMISLLRHGKTPGNLRGAFVGSENQPLAPEGREELLCLRKTVEYPDVEALFSSPMRRCVQTAAVLYPEHAPQLVPALRERHFGEFEGKTHGDIIATPGYEGWGMNEASMDFPGGEAKDAFFHRCGEGLWQVVEQCRAQGLSRIGIVAHGGVIMAVLAQFARPAKGYYHWACGNGRGYRLECDLNARELTVKGTLGT